MVDLLTEVDDALRRERMEKLWRAHADKIILALLAIILATAGMSFYRSWDEGIRQQQTTAMITWLEGKDFPKNALDVSKDWRPGLRAMARMQAARSYAQAKQPADALSLYAAVGKDKSAPLPLRHMANLMRATIMINAPKLADGEIENLLRPIAADPNSPAWPQASLTLAAFLAHKDGDKNANLTQALELLQPIIDRSDLPQSLTQRARDLAHMYRLQQENHAKPASPKSS